MTKFLTIQQVCERLQLAERTVYDLCRKGKLFGAAKVGGSWRVDEQALREWMKAGGEAATEPEGEQR